MIESAIFGFICGAFLSGFTCFRIGYETRIHDTREITAAKDATIQTFQQIYGVTKIRKELKNNDSRRHRFD